MNKNNRGIQRYPISSSRDCPLGVITFEQIEWTDHVARVVDISVIGIGIESNRQLEPGLVWFKERIGGYRSGVLMWTKREGSQYRGGIKFVSLSRDEEAYLQKQVGQAGPQTPLHDPDRIISSMINSYKKERNAVY